MQEETNLGGYDLPASWNVERAGVLDAPEYLRAAADKDSGFRVPTGIVPLDEILGGGLPTGKLTVLHGYTGVGKSELARQIRNSALNSDVACLHVDVELGAKVLACRDLSEHCRIAYPLLESCAAYEDPELFAKIREAEAEIGSRWSLKFWDASDTPPMESMSADVMGPLINELRASGKPLLIILDSLHRLSQVVDSDQRRTQVELFNNWASSLSRVSGAAVLMTAEQKRSSLGGKPKKAESISAIAESRSGEFQADLVIGMYEELAEEREAEAPDSEFSRYVSLVVDKNRGGSSGLVREWLEFKAPYWGMDSISAEEARARSVEVSSQTEELRVRALQLLDDGNRQAKSHLYKAIGANQRLARVVVDEEIRKERIVAIQSGKAHMLEITEKGKEYLRLRG